MCKAPYQIDVWIAVENALVFSVAQFIDAGLLLLGLADGEHCAETKSIAQRKLKLVEEKLSDLAAMQAALKRLIRSCQRTPGGQGCPIIDSFKEGTW